MALGLRDMWLELRGELEGLERVLLTGLLGPALILAVVAITDPLAFLLTPFPLFLASLASRESDRSGPAIALGALLGYLLLTAFSLSPLYPPFYRWVNRGVPAPKVESIPLSCRACSPPLPTLLWTFAAVIIVALEAIPILAAWVALSAYPAHVARSRFRRVPRLLLIMYSLALLADSATCSLCILSSRKEGPLSLFSMFALLDPPASLALALACLWKAWRGEGRDLLSFLTFYALVGTSRWWV